FYGTLEAIQSKWGGVITNMAAIGAIIPGFGSQFRAVAAEIRKSSAAAKDLKTATSEATGKVAENARAIEAALTGFTAPLASVVVALAELEEFQRRRVTVFLALFEETGQIETADVLFDGVADTMESDDGPDTATTTLALEPRSMALGRKFPCYYLPEDQEKRFPGDKGFGLVQAIQNREDTWGRT
ncbi:hypothetical protein JMM61_20625, partial [Rhodovulum sulfidophilum]